MEATLLSVPCMFWFLSLIIIIFFLKRETPRDRIVWGKRREMRSANLFIAFSRRQTGNHQEKNLCQFRTQQRRAGNWLSLHVCEYVWKWLAGLTLFVDLARIQVFALDGKKEVFDI